MSDLDKARLDAAFEAYWAAEGGTFKGIEAAIRSYLNGDNPEREEQQKRTRAEVSAIFDIERFTCDDCPSCATCQHAFDAYNTDGDCLADK
jgi:hypothetical protein